MVHHRETFYAFCRSLQDFWPKLVAKHLLTPLNNKAWARLMERRLKKRYTLFLHEHYPEQSISQELKLLLHEKGLVTFTRGKKGETFFDFMVDTDPDFGLRAADVLCLTFVRWLETRLVCTEPGEFRQLASFTGRLLKLGDTIQTLRRESEFGATAREYEVLNAWIDWRDLHAQAEWFKTHLNLKPNQPTTFYKPPVYPQVQLAQIDPVLAACFPSLALRITEALAADSVSPNSPTHV
jgi:hypothetical protein